MKRLIPLLILLLSSATCMAQKPTKPILLKVLQLNIWQEGSHVERGFDAIVDAVVHTGAEVVFFEEVSNRNGKRFVPRMIEALKQRGRVFYGQDSPLGVAVLSAYPIDAQHVVYPQGKGYGAILRASFQVNGHSVAAYAAHLDYRNYECYLPRGYSGTTWKKLDAPVLDADSVLAANRLSWRDEAIKIFLEEVKKEKGNLVLLGGDFNEPSHLDWQSDTKDKWDHNGLVVNWDCSRMLYAQGFRDAYRVLYPNPVTHPGFTFPSDNARAAVNKLTWAPQADERERIDFIYYSPNRRMKPVDALVVGPECSIVRSVRTKEEGKDRFLQPQDGWPTDHKGVLVTFKIRP